MTDAVSTDTPLDWTHLRSVPLLTSLSDERLRAVWSASVPLRRRAGQMLRLVGDPADHLLVLLRGRVDATATTAAGRTVRFGEWAAPCALDKVAVLDGGGHTATLIANEACELRCLPRGRFLELIDDAPSVRRHVLRVLANHARRQQERWTAGATMPAQARLAAWLLEAAADGSDSRVRMPGSQQSLADLLGTTRVTVNRALGRLRRDGLIEVRGDRIDILAPELLALRARNDRHREPNA